MYQSSQSTTIRRNTLVAIALLMFVTIANNAYAVQIGQRIAGGVVFYIDESGERGVVAATTDLPDTYDFQQAKEACEKFVQNGYSDWYLPSKWELNELYNHKQAVGGMASDHYWSSSDYFADYAWFQYFSTGFKSTTSKDNGHAVRPVRAF